MKTYEIKVTRVKADGTEVTEVQAAYEPESPAELAALFDLAASRRQECAACDGKGYVLDAVGTTLRDRATPCASCEGAGHQAVVDAAVAARADQVAAVKAAETPLEEFWAGSASASVIHHVARGAVRTVRAERFEITKSAHARSHGTAGPRGRGGWLFRRATAQTAYDGDLTGPIVSSPSMTYGDAVRWLRKTHGGGLWAVLP